MPTQDFVVLSPAVRQGQITSPSVQSPANILGIRFTLNLLLADKLATGLTASLHVEHSVDGSTNWLPVCGFGWTSYGPAGFRTNPDPFLTFKPTAFPSEFFRAILDVPQSLSVGATITVTT